MSQVDVSRPFYASAFEEQVKHLPEEASRYISTAVKAEFRPWQRLLSGSD
jgi:hypothetical protein